jgi:hypothetical protein
MGRAGSLALFLPVFICCAAAVRKSAPLTPDEAAAGFWERLNSVKSFRFDLRYHTDVPFKIAADFDGARENSDREAWEGDWWRGGEHGRVLLRAAGATQYEREGAGWRRVQRGLETRILDQAEPVLRGVRLRHLRSEHGRHVYEFEPEVPILDPTQTRRLFGLVEIDSRSGLPLRVYCHDSSKTAEWELRFAGFGRAARIEVPFLPAQETEAEPDRRLGRAEWGQALRVLDDRLARLGVEYRLRRTRSGLTLELDRAFSAAQTALLLGAGRVEVWAGRRATDSLPSDSLRVVGLAGDAARLMALTRRVATAEDLEVEPRLELPVDPKLGVKLRGSRAVADSGSTFVLLVDARALGTALSDRTGDLLFRDLGSEDAVRIVAALAESGALPAGFKAVERR